ncbi:lactosylceramide 1,3-N-acetyl-beta-D-glucosaminyltransferase B [Menidia menidia]|uniref:Hexosyltransferase n=1 Tax=Menidia menidia TaxID=238744 RepID=A0A8S4AWH1_9TELE|nr:unnamed protein product [Menidia menidia]
MFLNFRRLRRYQCMQLMTTCLVLSVVMVCWEQLDNGVVNHFKSTSYRYLVNSFSYINRSLTVPREEARRFSDFPYLLDHPDKCAGQDVFLLLFVKSRPENVGRRAAIRATWGNESYIQSALGVTVKVAFALGATEAPRRGRSGPQERLAAEDRLHGDLIQKDFLDSFHNLTLKLIMQLHWVHHRCRHARFFMTADDDIFVHTPNLVGYLQEARRRGAADLWIGRVYKGAPPIRSRDSKYFVPWEMYQWYAYPDYTAGAGYVVSGEVADKAYHASLTLNASLYIDDVFMGLCANAVGLSPQDHAFFSGDGRTPYHRCVYERMMTSHGHVEDLQELWAAATHPQVRRAASGPLGRLYCAAVRVALLCRPSATYPCKAAFS